MTTLHIIKIGGKIIEEKEKLEKALHAFASIEGHKILVHGGGKRADELCLQLGIEPHMVDGRRITDAATLEIVIMVYAGLINKNIVSGLQALGCNALGLSGADGNAVLVHKREVKQIDYGFAGDIDRVNADSIQALLEAGFTPVFCAITHNGRGQLLNTNADTIAASLATALASRYKVSLTYCFEKAGVLLDPDDEHSVIRELNPEKYEEYKARGIITAGMLPKLDNAFDTLRKGVNEVIIGGLEAIGTGKGTVVGGSSSRQ
jgi:acetylglutamate kinase